MLGLYSSVGFKITSREEVARVRLPIGPEPHPINRALSRRLFPRE